MKSIFTLCLLVLSGSSYSQTHVFLDFHPKVGGQYLQLGTIVQDLNGTAMKVDDFNYYISNVHIIHDGGQDLDLDTVMIVKAEEHELDLGIINVTNIEAVNFGVGVPQSLNHTDISQYPLNHPLSWQSPSMHWGWTAGYKFMLCDAWGDDNGDGNPTEIYQMHCLGDGNYKYVNLNVVPTVHSWGGVSVVIDCNLDEWIYGSDPGTTGIQHGSTGINATVMNNVAIRNVFTVPATADIEALQKEGNITFTTNNQSVRFDWEGVAGAKAYRLIDMNGRTIATNSVQGSTGEVTVNNVGSGTYLFYLLSKEDEILNKMKFIK